MPKSNTNHIPAINGKTNEEFVTELKNFHSSHKTPFNREPYLLGRKVDLLKLYNTVLSRGGLKKVTDEKAWSLIVEDLGLGRRCVNASLAIKQLYQRYLEPYERYHAHDEDGWPGGSGSGTGGGENDMDCDSEVSVSSSTRLRCGRYAPAPSECAVPMVYNENAHMIPPHMRHKWGLSTQLVELKEYTLLEKSLHSGLPNEVDFSLNTTLLMSSQPSGLNLTMNRSLVDLLLAHVGVFDEGFGSYLPVEPYWRQQDERNMLRYWYENILEPDARVFLLPGIFSETSTPESAKVLAEKIEAARRQLPLPVIYDLFNLRDDLTLPDTEGHRVFVVATALRNLALDDKCARIVAGHPQVLRFALLCGHARHAALRQLGQEMLALLRFPIKGPLERYFSRLLCQCVNDMDRTTRLRGLEMIARQCQLTDNRQFLSLDLPTEVYDAVISNLLLKDLHLVINSLEATYMLSTIGTDACDRLISNDHCIPLLMSLLTIEAQAMGTDGLIRVKIMQGPTPPPVITQTGLPLGHPASGGVRLVSGQTLMPPPNSVPRSGAAATLVPAGTLAAQQAARQGVARFHNRSVVQQVQPTVASGQPSAYIPIAPKPALAAAIPAPQPVANHSVQQQQNHVTAPVPQSQSPQPPSPSPRKSSTAAVQSNNARTTFVMEHPPHPHIVMHQYEHDPDAPTDRREFTLYWLRKYFEPYPQASVSRVHIYTEFQRAYSKQFQQLTNVTALEFHSCVKQAFPNVGQVKVQVPAGNVEIHYNHIKHINDRPPSIQIPISVTSTGTNIASQIVNKKNSASPQPQKAIVANNIDQQNHVLPSQLVSPKQPVHVCPSHLNHTNIVQALKETSNPQGSPKPQVEQPVQIVTTQLPNSLSCAVAIQDGVQPSKPAEEPDTTDQGSNGPHLSNSISRKRPQPSPPAALSSPVSSPAPKRSRPSSTGSVSDSLPNGEVDEKSNGLPVIVNGDEAVIRRVLNDTTPGALSNGSPAPARPPCLVNGESQPTTHVNGLVKTVLPALAAIKSEAKSAEESAPESGLPVIKTVNVPPQAVLIASSSQCNHASPIVNSCRTTTASPGSLITTSSQAQNQTCPHNQVHHHVAHQHACAHQHHCVHHAQHHHCCHHNPKVGAKLEGEAGGHTVNGIVRVPMTLAAKEVEQTVHTCTTFGSPLTPKSSRAGGSKSRRPAVRKAPLSGTTPAGAAQQSQIATPVSTTPPTAPPSGHVCEWDGCEQLFDTCTLLQKHVFATHVPVAATPDHPSSRRYECQWANCERVPRGLYSLQGHVQDMHLSPVAQQQAQLRRQQTNIPRTNPVTPRTTTPITPGPTIANAVDFPSTRCIQTNNGMAVYPVDAALQAIRRHSTVPDFLATDTAHCLNNVASIASAAPTWPPNAALREGPVTKHIRLTAALTLRNFVTYSDKAKECLRQEESHLAELALSAMESSKTICQFLYLLNEPKESL